MWFSKKPAGESVALIDISASCIGVALARIEVGKAPVLCYTLRESLDHVDTISPTTAMLKLLNDVGDRLVLEGAPQLRTATGSGSVDRVIVNMGSPWQETHIETKSIQKDAPFTVSKSLISEALTRDAEPPEGFTLTETVIATSLNGYAVKEALGKRANRAELTVLASTMEDSVREDVTALFRKLFHTSDISFTAFAYPFFAVLRDLYPHEKEFLVLSVSSEATDVASIKRGHVVDVGSLPHGTNPLLKAIRHAGDLAQDAPDVPESTTGQPSISRERNARFGIEAEKAEKEWVEALAGFLRAFAMRHALPRTVFLIAGDETRGFLKSALDAPSLHTLWLSDEPVSVIPVMASQFSSRITFQGLAEGDTMLSLLALYATQGAR
ncbi:MAG TPA: hypothetical protein VGB97_01260 [Candidatus Paceibacterota bacterium]|jgi:hypothetical protein